MKSINVSLLFLLSLSTGMYNVNFLKGGGLSGEELYWEKSSFLFSISGLRSPRTHPAKFCPESL